MTTSLALLSVAGCVSTIDGAPQEKLPAPVQKTKTLALCSGQTPVDATAWQVDREGVVHVDIDTSHCNLSGNPLYFTSLGGKEGHWVSRGATSIYNASRNGFRVVVLHRDADNIAREQGWHINWMARPEELKSRQLCTGRAEPDQSKKTQPGSVFFRVDLRDCGFSEPPVLLTSLGGEQGHALTRGASAAYWTDANRFAVFVQKRDLTLEQAIKWGWHINWSAMPAASSTELCAGKTEPGATAWEQLGKNGLVTKLNTEGCSAPLVFTTLGGEHSHWFATGIGSIYQVDAERFDLRINRYKASPKWANREKWHVHWTRVANSTGSMKLY
jgi:hypothetical protein